MLEMDMDSAVLVAIAVGVVSLAIYYISFGLRKSKPLAKDKTISPSGDKKSPVAAPKATREIKEYTVEEVSQHNKRADLWLIVEGKVYDVTPFVATHPGGDAILNRPGQDNTDTFFHESHPESVRDQLAEYYIGTVKK